MGVFEPRVQVRGVIRYEVDDDVDPSAVRFREETVEVGERAEKRIDVSVIADVVAKVGHG